MKQRFRLYRRNGGIYYLHDSETGKQTSLGTRDRAEATALFVARTQAHRQAHLNLQLARTYLAATDPMVAKRTWQVPMEELAKTKLGATHERWQYVIKDKAFDLIRNLPILETQAEHFLKVLQVGTISTNVFLRRIHNFALDVGWLRWPVIVKRRWPGIHFQEKRAITHAEHLAILERERNPEWRAFYALLWHLAARNLASPPCAPKTSIGRSGSFPTLEKRQAQFLICISRMKLKPFWLRGLQLGRCSPR